jgi:adenylosuccinate lyase
LGLDYNPLTTQIEPHDVLVDSLDAINHCGRILHNLSTDIWLYISRGVLRLKAQAGQVGSSTMPHKVNPIKFENAEGNLEIADAMFSQLAHSLVSSRLQRDLSDSTQLRNLGVAFGHWLTALAMIKSGLLELSVDQKQTQTELNAHYEVLTEAIQTQLRVAEIESGSTDIDPYNLVKDFSRGNFIDRQAIADFVNQLDLAPSVKQKLLDLTPEKYTGLASQLVERYLGVEGDSSDTTSSTDSVTDSETEPITVIHRTKVPPRTASDSNIISPSDRSTDQIDPL